MAGPTQQDLIDMEQDVTHFAEVATGKVGGVAGGASIASSTNRLGGVRKTLPEAIAELEASGLRGDLTNNTDPDKGAELVGVSLITSTPTITEILTGTLFAVLGGLIGRVKMVFTSCPINVFWYMTPLQIADVIARTATLDVRAAHQSALDAAYSKGGGTVVIPAGVHKIIGRVMVRSNTAYIGEGAASVIYNPSTTRNTPYEADCIIVGYGYECGPNGEHFNPTYDDATIAQLLSEDYSKLTTENVTVSDLCVKAEGTGLGIWTMNAKNVTIKNIYSIDTLTPVNVGNDALSQQAACANVTIENLYQLDGTKGIWYDLLFVGASRGVVASKLFNNKSKPSIGNAAIVFNWAYDWILEKAVITGTSAKRGVEVGSQNGTDVVRGVIEQSTISGFGQLVRSTCGGVTIDGNDLLSSPNEALKLEAADIKVTGNTFRNNTTDLAGSVLARGNTYSNNRGLASVPHDGLAYAALGNRMFGNTSISDVPSGNAYRDAVNGYELFCATPSGASVSSTDSALLSRTPAVVSFVSGSGGSAKLYFKLPDGVSSVRNGKLCGYASAAGQVYTLKLVGLDPDTNANAFSEFATIATFTSSASGDVNSSFTSNTQTRPNTDNWLEVTIAFSTSASQFRSVWVDLLY